MYDNETFKVLLYFDFLQIFYGIYVKNAPHTSQFYNSRWLSFTYYSISSICAISIIHVRPFKHIAYLLNIVLEMN